jgi:voltage-gated potassium channel
VTIIAESFDGLEGSVVLFLRIFEYLSVAVFTLEYLTRLWTADYRFPESKHPYLKYLLSPMAVMDLLAIAPFYLPLVLHFDLRFLRVLRLFRLLRVFKLNRYSDSLNLIGRVIRKEKSKLLMSVFLIAVLIMLVAAVIYFFENAVQPEGFPNLIETLLWAATTMATIDTNIYPVTGPGRVLTTLFAILGVGLVALPSGIICSGLINEISDEEHRAAEEKMEVVVICPHCGELIKFRDNAAMLRAAEPVNA